MEIYVAPPVRNFEQGRQEFDVDKFPASPPILPAGQRRSFQTARVAYYESCHSRRITRTSRGRTRVSRDRLRYAVTRRYDGTSVAPRTHAR
jgi:hypothetical protein